MLLDLGLNVTEREIELVQNRVLVRPRLYLRVLSVEDGELHLETVEKEVNGVHGPLLQRHRHLIFLLQQNLHLLFNLIHDPIIIRFNVQNALFLLQILRHRALFTYQSLLHPEKAFLLPFHFVLKLFLFEFVPRDLSFVGLGVFI